MTFHRLLFREIVVPLVLSLSLVSLMLVALQILQLNEILFGSGFEPIELVRSALYFFPHFGIIAVPLAFLLAVMLGLGRLAEDNELIAFTALGRSPVGLYVVPSIVGLVLGGAVGWLAFEGEPWGLRGLHAQLDAIIKRNVANDIRPGVFFEEIPRVTLFTAGANERTGDWERVLLHDSAGDGTPFFITAKEGRVAADGDDAELELRLGDGELHRVSEDGTYTRARFGTAAFALGVSDFLKRQNKFNRPANELRFAQMRPAIDAAREAGDEAAARRLSVARHARIASVLSCLLFGLVAVPLAAGGQGARSRSFVSTVVAFAAYYVLLATFRGLGEGGSLAPWLAAWMPNLVALVVASVLAVRFLRGPVAGGGR